MHIYKRLADTIRRFDDIKILASEIESIDEDIIYSLEELNEFLEDELDYASE